MKQELEELKITERQIENLSGFEVNDIFIGSAFGGAYRPSLFKNGKRLAFFCLTEILVFALIFIFTLPIGIYLIHNSHYALNDTHLALQFLQITLGSTLVVFLLWNIHMRVKLKRLNSLANILDEVDKYNQVIEAINILDKLESVGSLHVNFINRSEVTEALHITRDSLVCGLMTEKILRDNRMILVSQHDLLSNIENDLANLKTLEINNQANQYGQLLNNALQIGMSVYQEVQNLSSQSQSEP